MRGTKGAFISGYFVFLAFSLKLGFKPGIGVARNFSMFSMMMLKILPCAFIIIGLFEVWVKKETVERHLGRGSGIKGYIWGIVLAGTTVGGVYVAFPASYSLYRKGARLGVIFTYVGASAICRVPMTVFEASFLGIKFSLVRLFVSIPLVVLSSAILGSFLEKRGFKITAG